MFIIFVRVFDLRSYLNRFHLIDSFSRPRGDFVLFLFLLSGPGQFDSNECILHFRFFYGWFSLNVCCYWHTHCHILLDICEAAGEEQQQQQKIKSNFNSIGSRHLQRICKYVLIFSISSEMRVDCCWLSASLVYVPIWPADMQPHTFCVRRV